MQLALLHTSAAQPHKPGQRASRQHEATNDLSTHAPHLLEAQQGVELLLDELRLWAVQTDHGLLPPLLLLRGLASLPLVVAPGVRFGRRQAQLGRQAPRRTATQHATCVIRPPQFTPSRPKPQVPSRAQEEKLKRCTLTCIAGATRREPLLLVCQQPELPLAAAAPRRSG